MNHRVLFRSAAVSAALALLLAACQPQAPSAEAPEPTPAPEAPAAPAPAIADEPALDPDAAPADEAAGETGDEAGSEAPPAGAGADAAPAAPAADEPAVRFAVAGEHYDPIPGGQPFEPLDGRIEVVEVFNYVCPACAMFEPLVSSWKKRLGEDVRFTYLPAPFGGNWDPYVRAYYAAEAMGIADRAHEAVFEAIHVSRTLKGERGTDSPADIARVYAQFGADPAQFVSTMSSFTVNAKFGRARQHITDQRANSTPTLIVNGRYRIKGRSWEELLQNADRVIAQVRAGG